MRNIIDYSKSNCSTNYDECELYNDDENKELVNIVRIKEKDNLLRARVNQYEGYQEIAMLKCSSRNGGWTYGYSVSIQVDQKQSKDLDSPFLFFVMLFLIIAIVASIVFASVKYGSRIVNWFLGLFNGRSNNNSQITTSMI